MRYFATIPRLLLWATLWLLPVAAGCASTQVVDIFRRPLRIGIISNNYVDLVMRYGPLRDQLNRRLSRPVVTLPELTGNSIAVHLKYSPQYYHLLYLDPINYLAVSKQCKMLPLAIRVNRLDSTEVQGLIVVPVDSQIKQADQLYNKRFAFGPYGSAYMFYNALDALQTAKITVDRLKQVSYWPNCNAVANRLIGGWADAGVVTDVWWQTSDARSLGGKLLKDHLRIIGRTKPLPEWIWAATEGTAAADVNRIQRFLLEDIKNRETIRQHLKADGFIKLKPENLDTEKLSKLIDGIMQIPDRPLLSP